jgi:hypothetical protein
MASTGNNFTDMFHWSLSDTEVPFSDDTVPEFNMPHSTSCLNNPVPIFASSLISAHGSSSMTSSGAPSSSSTLSNNYIKLQNQMDSTRSSTHVDQAVRLHSVIIYT